MDESQTVCPVHGRRGIGLVCEHIAFAALRALDGASSEQWFRNARGGPKGAAVA
jgi:hypothetical protein